MSDIEFRGRTVSTPTGELWLISARDKLWSAEFRPRWVRAARRLDANYGLVMKPGARADRCPILQESAKALAHYFRGDLDALRSIPLRLEGSDFQTKIWRIVRRVRPGRVISYRELAERAEVAGAFRATGAANGANPCALFVPCHRIVASSGQLTGYGGGIQTKAYLLSHEGVPTSGARLAR